MNEDTHEDTLVKTLDLPPGQDWAWFADANIVGLAPHLTPEGRERALSEVQAYWRRSCLRIVPDELPSTLATQPMNIRDVIEAM